MNNGKRKQYNSQFDPNFLEQQFKKTKKEDKKKHKEEVYENTDVKTWYPRVGCIYLDAIKDVDKVAAECELKKHYRFARYIPVFKGTEVQDKKIDAIFDDICNVKDKKMEGIKFTIRAHGSSNTQQMVCNENMVEAIRKIAPEVKEFLEQHKQAKLYIQVDPCYGAFLVKDRSTKEYTDVFALLSELFQNYQDRIYCRCSKAGMIHRRYYSNLECIDTKNICYKDGKKNKKEYKMQYFPFSAWRNRYAPEYNGEKTKRVKNEFLNWTKEKNKADNCITF